MQTNSLNQSSAGTSFLLGLTMGFGGVLSIDVIYHVFAMLYSFNFTSQVDEDVTRIVVINLCIRLGLYALFLIVLHKSFKNRLATFGASIGLILGKVALSFTVMAFVFHFK